MGSGMRTTIAFDEGGKADSIGKLAWIMALLVLTTWGAAGFGARFIWNASVGRQFYYWPSLLSRWAFPAAMAFVSLELMVVLYVYRPLRGAFELRPGESAEGANGKRIMLGLAGGMCAFAVSLPLLLITDSNQGFIREMLSCPSCPGVIVQAGLLLMVLPSLSELVFRGIVFRILEARRGLWFAASVSAVLFACVWPVLNPGVAIIAGVSSAVVMRRSGSILSCIVANASLTALAETLFMLRKMHLL